jgi:hypothetical protein
VLAAPGAGLSRRNSQYVVESPKRMQKLLVKGSEERNQYTRVCVKSDHLGSGCKGKKEPPPRCSQRSTRNSLKTSSSPSSNTLENLVQPGQVMCAALQCEQHRGVLAANGVSPPECTTVRCCCSVCKEETRCEPPPQLGGTFPLGTTVEVEKDATPQTNEREPKGCVDKPVIGPWLDTLNFACF